ncbi:MAG: hypothetical protein QJR00_06965, partial [Bacillota bacterium]|nr:hypothetical protein [Bacillota bacterium]
GGVWRLQGGSATFVVKDLPSSSSLSYGLWFTRDRRLLWPQPAGTEPGVLAGSVLTATLDGSAAILATGLGWPRSLAQDEEGGSFYVLDQPQVSGPVALYPLVESQDYGWPLCSAEKGGTLACADLPAPLWTFNPEAEVWGLLLYRGNAFPDAFHGAFFFTLWGDPTGKRDGKGVMAAFPGAEGTWHVLPFSQDFWHASALAVDKSGNLYVADMGRGDIVRFSPSSPAAQDSQ